MAEDIYKIPENPIYNKEIRRIDDDDPVSASEILNPVLAQMIENTAAVKKQVDEGAGAIGQGQVYREVDGHVTIPSVNSLEDMEGIPWLIRPTSYYRPGWPFKEDNSLADYGRQAGVTTHACVSADKEFIFFGGPVQEGIPTLSAVKTNGSLHTVEPVELFSQDELPGTVTGIGISKDGKLLVVTHDKNPELVEGDEYLCLSMYLKNENGMFSRIPDPLSGETAMGGPRIGRTTSVTFQPKGNLFCVTSLQGSTSKPCAVSLYQYDSEAGEVRYVKDVMSNPSYTGAFACDWSEDGKYLGVAGLYNNGVPFVFRIQSTDKEVTVTQFWNRYTSWGGNIYTIKFIPDSSPTSFLCLGSEQWEFQYVIEEYDYGNGYIHGEFYSVYNYWAGLDFHQLPDLSDALYYPNITFTKSQNGKEKEMHVVVTFYEQRPSLHVCYTESAQLIAYPYPCVELGEELYNIIAYHEDELLALPRGTGETAGSPKVFEYAEYYHKINVNNWGDVPLVLLQLGDINSYIPFTMTYNSVEKVFEVHDPSKDDILSDVRFEVDTLKERQELLPGAYERTRLHAEKNYALTIDGVNSYEDMSEKLYWVMPSDLTEYPLTLSYHYDSENSEVFSDLGGSVTQHPIFTPDGKYLFIFSKWSSQEADPINVYEVSDNYGSFRKLDSRDVFDVLPSVKEIACAEISKDGKILVIGFFSAQSASEYVLFYKAGEDMTTFTRMADPAVGIRTGKNTYGAKFSPDGKYLCVVSATSQSAYQEEAIVLYDYDSETGTVTFNRSLSSVEGVLTDIHSYPVRCSWSPDSRYLVVSCYYGEKSIIVFDTENDFKILDYNYTREDNTSGNYRMNWALFDPSLEGPRKYRIYGNSSYGTFPAGSYIDNASIYQIDAEANAINRIDPAAIGMTDSGGNGTGDGYLARQPIITPDGQWLIWSNVGRYPNILYRILPDGTMKRAKANCFAPLSSSLGDIGFSPDGSTCVASAHIANGPIFPMVAIYDPAMNDAFLNINDLGNKPVVLAGDGQIDKGVPVLISYDQPRDVLVVHNPSQGAIVSQLKDKIGQLDNETGDIEKDVEAIQAGICSLAETVGMLTEQMEKAERILQAYETEDG